MRTLLAVVGFIGLVQSGVKGGVHGGFRWGRWSPWEQCKKGTMKRRRVCHGPVAQKKLSKNNCLHNLEGGNIEEVSCNKTEMKLEDQIGRSQVGGTNPLLNTKWQTWQPWSRCSNKSRKRYRYCGDAFRREIQPNRVCKNIQKERGVARSQTKSELVFKQTETCSSNNILGPKSGNNARKEIQEIAKIKAMNIKVSAPECYYLPGTKLNRNDKSPTRIVGGRPSTYGDNPHIVMLSYKGFGGYGQFCDGSIIHKRFVLTAAHCFVGWDESPSTYEVVAGAYNKVEKTDKQKTYFLESITCHESYRVSSRQIIYDVCLLKTVEDMDFNEYVWPICVPDDLPPPNDGTFDRNCTVAGWGDTRFTGDEKILNEVDVPVLTYETCVDWYEAENILIDPIQHVCAGYEKGGLDACQGDSGGPFVCKRDTTKIGGQHTHLNVLTGVVSFGVGCAQEKNPGVYTNVHHFLPYLYKIMNEHDACVPTNPCQNGGRCVDTFHGYHCDCPGNFVGDNCELDSDNIDACYNNNCDNGKCVVNEDGASYHCDCFDDYTGDTCQILTNPCRNHNCNGNGECVLDGSGKPSCNCNSGFSGSDCADDINECTNGSAKCNAASSCINIEGSYECVCPSGFEGDGMLDGKGCTDIDECAEGMDNCGPQSVCTNTFGAFQCECRDGWRGNPPAVKCQRQKIAETAVVARCENIVSYFDQGRYLNDVNGRKYTVSCGMADGGDRLDVKALLATGIDHPVSEVGKVDSSFPDSCVIGCKPGYLASVPKFGWDKSTEQNFALCLKKGKKTMWRPNNGQFKCYGCGTPEGTTLSDCEVKGKKSIKCTAKCNSGKAGSAKVTCIKSKGKYIWDDNSGPAFAAQC